MPISQTYVFIDESGTLPDKNDPYFVISAIVTKNPNELIKIANKLRKKSNRASALRSEIKFYKSGEKTIINYLALLNLSDCKVFILSVDKQNRSVTDTPEHYSIFVNILLKSIFEYNRAQRMTLVLDRHFHAATDQELFNKHISSKSNRITNIRHVDSQRERAVNAADMVAGSYLRLISRDESKFVKLFRSKIVKIMRRKWTAIKRENLAEPV